MRAYLVTMQDGMDRAALELAVDRLMSVPGVYTVKLVEAPETERAGSYRQPVLPGQRGMFADADTLCGDDPILPQPMRGAE